MVEHPAKSYRRVGLFGGTFDPIHKGHITAAIGILERLKLDHLYFIPAYQSPLKEKPSPTDPKHRLEMTRLSIRNIPEFSVSEFEINRECPSYTIDTVRHYKHLFSDDTEFYFIIGSDTFLDLSRWKDIREVISLCNLIVVARPNYHLTPLSEILHDPKLLKEFVTETEGEVYKHFSGHQICLFQLPSVDISATELREKIRNKKPFSSFVTSNVEDYIRKHGIYQRSKKNSKA